MKLQFNERFLQRRTLKQVKTEVFVFVTILYSDWCS